MDYHADINTERLQLLEEYDLTDDPQIHTKYSRLLQKTVSVSGVSIFNRDMWMRDLFLQDSCTIGSLKLVQQAIIYSQNFNDALQCACKNGSVEIAQLLLDYGANSVDESLTIACENNNVDVAQLMIFYGALKWDDGFVSACTNNYVSIVQMLMFHSHFFPSSIHPKTMIKGLQSACTHDSSDHSHAGLIYFLVDCCEVSVRDIFMRDEQIKYLLNSGWLLETHLKTNNTCKALIKQRIQKAHNIKDMLGVYKPLDDVVMYIVAFYLNY